MLYVQKKKKNLKKKRKPFIFIPLISVLISIHFLNISNLHVVSEVKI